MTITQFFALDFQYIFPEIIYNNKAIRYDIYNPTVNHYIVEVIFYRCHINIKYAEFLELPENQTKFINWFKEYALSVISESYDMTGRFI